MPERFNDTHLDEGVRASQSSDWSFVATRVVMLAVTFFYLGRAVVHGASPGSLLLPLVAEFVSMMWLGLGLAILVVDCPTFIGTRRRPVRVIFWTALIVGCVSIVLGWEEGGGFVAERIRPAWASAWDEVVSTGVVWAMLAGIVGLLVSTVREVIQWRRDGGVFIWHSVFGTSFRVAVVVLMALFSPFVLIPLADSALPWLVETQQRLAWTVFGFLLVVEVSALAVGIVLHRELKAKDGSDAQAGDDRSVAAS